MKPFIQTTVAGFIVLIIAMLIVVCLKVEKHKAQIEAQKHMIGELTEDLHTYEVMYLKCVGSVQIEKHGAHYVDGKIKFYETK